MSSATAVSPLRSWQGFVHRHAGLRIGGLLALPMTWLVLLYIVPLAMLFVSAFWTTDSFTGEVVRAFTLENFQRLFTDPAYVTVALRTLGVAVSVTVLCLLLAVPIGLFMARVATARWQPLLVALMLTPLWASYLVKVYAWRVIFSPEGGVLESTVGFSPGFGWLAVVIVLTYLWLPYMILPVYVGMQNVPQSLLEASSDLGASTSLTFRRVLLPMVFPCGRVDLHVLPEPRRLHHGAVGRRQGADVGQRGLPEFLHRPSVRRGGGVHDSADHDRLPDSGATHRRTGEPVRGLTA